MNCGQGTVNGRAPQNVIESVARAEGHAKQPHQSPGGNDASLSFGRWRRGDRVCVPVGPGPGSGAARGCDVGGGERRRLSGREVRCTKCCTISSPRRCRLAHDAGPRGGRAQARGLALSGRRDPPCACTATASTTSIDSKYRRVRRLSRPRPARRSSTAKARSGFRCAGLFRFDAQSENARGERPCRLRVYQGAAAVPLVTCHQCPPRRASR